MASCMSGREPLAVSTCFAHSLGINRSYGTDEHLASKTFGSLAVRRRGLNLKAPICLDSVSTEARKISVGNSKFGLQVSCFQKDGFSFRATPTVTGR